MAPTKSTKGQLRTLYKLKDCRTKEELVQELTRRNRSKETTGGVMMMTDKRIDALYKSMVVNFKLERAPKNTFLKKTKKQLQSFQIEQIASALAVVCFSRVFSSVGCVCALDWFRKGVQHNFSFSPKSKAW